PHEAWRAGRPPFFEEGWFLLGGGSAIRLRGRAACSGPAAPPGSGWWASLQTHPSAIPGAGPTSRFDHNSLTGRDLLTRPPFGQTADGDSSPTNMAHRALQPSASSERRLSRRPKRQTSALSGPEAGTHCIKRGLGAITLLGQEPCSFCRA